MIGGDVQDAGTIIDRFGSKASYSLMARYDSVGAVLTPSALTLRPGWYTTFLGSPKYKALHPSISYRHRGRDAVDWMALGTTLVSKS